MSAPRIVVFDIGNVLLHWDPRLLYRSMFADAETMEWFLAEVCSPDFNRKLDGGRPVAEGIEELIAQHPAYERQIRAYDERWLETTNGAMTASVALFDELRGKRVPVYAITNFSAEKFEVARRSFEFLHRFDGIVVSGAERLLKPEPEIYRLLLTRYGLVANDCLFIDDSLPNVEGARAVGFHGYHFRDAKALRHELVRHGLLA